jgi:arylsulfatase A-like enzyme
MTAATNWLELNYNQYEKFFLYVDTFDPHEPWDPPKYYVDMYDPGYEGEEVIYPWYNLCDMLTPEELNHCKALYAGEVTMVDRWIGMLLKKVEDLGLYEDTAVIFTSDHGFCLGEHNLIGKLICTPKVDSAFVPLYDEIAHVPLVIRLPNVKGGKHCDALVQSPDLTPTIIDLLEARNPGTMAGESLIPLIMEEEVDWRDFIVSSPPLSSINSRKGLSQPLRGQRITITTDEWSLIYPGQIEDMLKENPGRRKIFDTIEKTIGKVEKELFNLRKDPTWKNNVFNEEKDVAKELHSKFVEFLGKVKTKEEYLRYWTKL